MLRSLYYLESSLRTVSLLYPRLHRVTGGIRKQQPETGIILHGILVGAVLYHFVMKGDIHLLVFQETMAMTFEEGDAVWLFYPRRNMVFKNYRENGQYPTWLWKINHHVYIIHCLEKLATNFKRPVYAMRRHFFILFWALLTVSYPRQSLFLVLIFLSAVEDPVISTGFGERDRNLRIIRSASVKLCKWTS